MTTELVLTFSHTVSQALSSQHHIKDPQQTLIENTIIADTNLKVMEIQISAVKKPFFITHNQRHPFLPQNDKIILHVALIHAHAGWHAGGPGW